MAELRKLSRKPLWGERAPETGNQGSHSLGSQAEAQKLQDGPSPQVPGQVAHGQREGSGQQVPSRKRFLLQPKPQNNIAGKELEAHASQELLWWPK